MEENKKMDKTDKTKQKQKICSKLNKQFCWNGVFLSVQSRLLLLIKSFIYEKEKRTLNTHSQPIIIQNYDLGFAPVLHSNTTALSQSESSNFLCILIDYK